MFGCWFRELAKPLATEQTLAALATGAASGAAAVQRLGGAKVGDRTMVDALVPAAEALRSAVGRDDDLVTALAAAAHGDREGAENTRNLLGHCGRASYGGDAARGTPDPGAVTVALFIESALPSS